MHPVAPVENAPPVVAPVEKWTTSSGGEASSAPVAPVLRSLRP
jgi:hypothetical protein